MKRTSEQLQADIKGYIDKISESIKLDSQEEPDRIGKQIAMMVMCSAICAVGSPMLSASLALEAASLTSNLKRLGYETDTKTILAEIGSKIDLNDVEDEARRNVSSFKSMMGMEDPVKQEEEDGETSIHHSNLVSLFESASPYGAVCDAPDMTSVKLDGDTE